MSWKSIGTDAAGTAQGYTEAELKEDYKNAVRLEQYRVSQIAVYMPKKEYLPLNTVISARVQGSSLSTKGCCGLSLPVHLLILEYGGERPARLMFEKEANALKALEIIEKITGQN